MEKLTIENLASYFPYKILGISPTGSKFYLSIGSNMLGKGIENRGIETFINDEYKLILRPLSDLTKEIEHNGEMFVPIDIIYKLWNEKSLGQFSKSIILQKVQLYTKSMPHFIVEKLHSWHFDTDGLIDARLAIDINELKK